MISNKPSNTSAQPATQPKAHRSSIGKRIIFAGMCLCTLVLIGLLPSWFPVEQVRGYALEDDAPGLCEGYMLDNPADPVVERYRLIFDQKPDFEDLKHTLHAQHPETSCDQHAVAYKIILQLW